MRTRFLAMIFCVLVVGNVLAQKSPNWVKVHTPNEYSGGPGAGEIDMNNIKRLPNGNVVYFWRFGYTVYEEEVDCVKKQARTLTKTKLAHRDEYGNSVPGAPTERVYPTWTKIGDGSPGYYEATKACRSAPQIGEKGSSSTKTDKPAKKRIVGKKN